MSRTRVVLALAAAFAAAMALTGCGGDEAEKLSTTSTTSAEAESTTTEATDDKVDEQGGDQSDLPTWQRTANPFRDRIGETIEFECDPEGEASTVWGTNTYTDDSSVCTAAVHVGLITFDDGGTVKVEILAGEQEYIGSTSNGVTTKNYGSWGGSFRFPDAEQLDVEATIDWTTTANDYTTREATEFTVECQPDGEFATVWGTDVFTADSSICTAAVHAGLITVDDGGEVTFRLLPGQDSYTGSTANGVTTQDYGSWGESFEFVD